jgi:DNA-binding HxlR family transcriptional regulator
MRSIQSVPGHDEPQVVERDGLVNRTVTASVPVRVDYELTDLGHSLQDPIKLLKAWAEDHVPDVREAQERYDAGKNS